MSFKDKVALVTGGANGIGRAYCLALLNEGMKVCVCDINESSENEFINEVSENLKANIFFQKCDVSIFSNFKDTFDKTVEKFGKIDVVVNNAGIVNEHDWRDAIEVNLVGVIHGVKLAFQYMGIDNGGSDGYIVNTASRVVKYNPVAPVYCATKCGVIGLTKSYGSDYHFKKSGITVNAICPASVNTAIFETFITRTLDPELSKKSLEGRNFIKAKEVGKALIKILKDGKNGSLLKIDEFCLQYM